MFGKLKDMIYKVNNLIKISKKLKELNSSGEVIITNDTNLKKAISSNIDHLFEATKGDSRFGELKNIRVSTIESIINRILYDLKYDTK